MLFRLLPDLGQNRVPSGSLLQVREGLRTTPAQQIPVGEHLAGTQLRHVRDQLFPSDELGHHSRIEVIGTGNHSLVRCRRPGRAWFLARRCPVDWRGSHFPFISCQPVPTSGLTHGVEQHP